jgi:hypothetical protein
MKEWQALCHRHAAGRQDPFATAVAAEEGLHLLNRQIQELTDPFQLELLAASDEEYADHIGGEAQGPLVLAKVAGAVVGREGKQSGLEALSEVGGCLSIRVCSGGVGLWGCGSGGGRREGGGRRMRFCNQL